MSQLESVDIIVISAHQSGDAFGFAPSGPIAVISLSLDVVDPRLKSLQEEEIEEWSEVIRNCVQPDPEKRPTMKEVTSRLKEITAMGPDGANPKASPLWWAEMAITSTDSS